MGQNRLGGEERKNLKKTGKIKMKKKKKKRKKEKKKERTHPCEDGESRLHLLGVWCRYPGGKVDTLGGVKARLWEEGGLDGEIGPARDRRGKAELWVPGTVWREPAHLVQQLGRLLLVAGNLLPALVAP